MEGSSLHLLKQRDFSVTNPIIDYFAKLFTRNKFGILNPYGVILKVKQTKTSLFQSFEFTEFGMLSNRFFNLYNLCCDFSLFALKKKYQESAT